MILWTGKDRRGTSGRLTGDLKQVMRAVRDISSKIRKVVGRYV